MELEAGSLSDVGRTRDHNEDFLGMWRPADAAQRRRKGELFLVADGIGGHQAGEVASRMAVEHIIQAYGHAPGDDVVAELVQAIEGANAAIYAMGQGQDRRWRMGTTLVGALVRDRQLHVVNVGDSRAYLVRGGRAEQISQDHSIVAEQVRLGLLDAERAENQEYRSAITRAVGHKPQVQVDTFTRTLQEGDIIVLCTDGLSGPVKSDEIARIVSGQPPAQAVASLVALANSRGGKDNISAIVLKARRQARPRRATWWWVIGALAFIAAALALLLAAALGFSLGNRHVPRQPPIVAKIEPVQGQSENEFARMMGYSNVEEMVTKIPLRPQPPWPPVKPKEIYVLLTGRVSRVQVGPPCQFTLSMGETPYSVMCPPDIVPPQAALVSVLGRLVDEPSRRVEPLSLDVNEVKWLGLSAAWKNVYAREAGPHRRLVYTVVSAYTVLEAGGRSLERDYGFGVGERVAVYGEWDIIETGASRYMGLMSFERVFGLEGELYKERTGR